MFNRTDIVFALMDCGASMDYKNAQGNWLYAEFCGIPDFKYVYLQIEATHDRVVRLLKVENVVRNSFGSR